MVFLQTYGVTNALCLRIVRAYGADARKILTTEPYRVCREVEGVGFKTADNLGQYDVRTYEGAYLARRNPEG